LPARHWSDPGSISFQPERLRRRKEGVGETSGQTAWIELQKALAPPEAGPAEETSFLRSVRIA
jgi:hypothetical protein